MVSRSSELEVAMMSITTRSSRELSPKKAEAKRAALQGPVFITIRRRSTHVLLSFDGYQQLAKHRRNIADALAMPGDVHFEFEAPRYSIATDQIEHLR